MMTRKDYIKLASLIEQCPNNKDKDSFVSRLADYLEQDNPNFNRGKFVHACYWTKEKYEQFLKNKNKEKIYLDKAHTQLFGI
jgi:hypothetical protein